MGFAGAEALVEAACGGLGDVLGEGPGRDAGGEDARDGLVLEGAEGAGVAQGGAQVGRGVAPAKKAAASSPMPSKVARSCSRSAPRRFHGGWMPWGSTSTPALLGASSCRATQRRLAE